VEIKYRFHWYVYLISWAIPIAFFISRMEDRPIYNNTFHDVYTWFFLSLTVFFAIVGSTGYCAVSDKGLRLYSFFENKYIDYDEIECVVLLPQKDLWVF
jgi:hypothetical protein